MKGDCPLMHQLYYQHPETWFGDCMPIFADGAFQLFHQRDTRHPGPFGDPFGWALARTTDFLTYQDLGEVVHRGADDAQDQFIFAGSVFEADGRYTLSTPATTATTRPPARRRRF